MQRFTDKRKRLTGNYKTLFNKISAILFRNDPIGINFEKYGRVRSGSWHNRNPSLSEYFC